MESTGTVVVCRMQFSYYTTHTGQEKEENVVGLKPLKIMCFIFLKIFPLHFLFFMRFFNLNF